MHSLQTPVSRPTAKQLQSLLNATDNTAVGVDVSIGGRTFMFGYVDVTSRWLVERTSEAGQSRVTCDFGVST